MNGYDGKKCAIQPIKPAQEGNNGRNKMVEDRRFVGILGCVCCDFMVYRVDCDKILGSNKI